MSKPELKSAPIELIDANPFRRLDVYPYIPEKIEALRRSLQDVGFWEGVLARQTANGRYQIAFGHHRIEAARREGLKEVPLIVRDLTDKEMLQFMGRENQEEYKPGFLVLLETWEAAVEFVKCRTGSCNMQVIDVARVLGWTRHHGTKDRENISDAARACSAAYNLVQGGYLTREDLHGLTIKEARVITERARAIMKQTDDAARHGVMPRSEVQKAKEHVGKAASFVARKVRDGCIEPRTIQANVDFETYRFSKEARKRLPELERFGIETATYIEKMLDKDATAERLAEIVKSLPHIQMEEDVRLIGRLNLVLDQLIRRAEKWKKKLVVPKKKPEKKVIPTVKMIGQK
jgi:hypothetical protein